MDKFGRICVACRGMQGLQFMMACKQPVCESCILIHVDSAIHSTEHVFVLPSGTEVDADDHFRCPAPGCKHNCTILDLVIRSLYAQLSKWEGVKDGFTVKVQQGRRNKGRGKLCSLQYKRTNEDTVRHAEVQTHGSSFMQTHSTQTKKLKCLQSKETQWPVVKERATQAGYVYSCEAGSKEGLRMPGSEVSGCGPVTFRHKNIQTEAYSCDAGTQCVLTKCNSGQSVLTQVWSRRSLPGDGPLGPICRFKRDAICQVDMIDYNMNGIFMTEFAKDMMMAMKHLMGVTSNDNATKEEMEARERSLKGWWLRWECLPESTKKRMRGSGKGEPVYSIPGNVIMRRGGGGDSHIIDLPFPNVMCTEPLNEASHVSCRMGKTPCSPSAIPRPVTPSPESKQNMVAATSPESKVRSKFTLGPSKRERERQAQLLEQQRQREAELLQQQKQYLQQQKRIQQQQQQQKFQSKQRQLQQEQRQQPQQQQSPQHQQQVSNQQAGEHQARRQWFLKDGVRCYLCPKCCYYNTECKCDDKQDGGDQPRQVAK